MSSDKYEMNQNTEMGKRKIPKYPFIIVGIFLAVFVIGMIIENVNSEKIVICNDSGMDIEFIQVYFVDLNDEPHDILGLDSDLSLKNGEKYSAAFIPAEDINTEGAFLEVEVRFAGKNTIIENAGYFSRPFHGKISVSFDKTKNGVSLDIKAGEGLFQSTANTKCDDTIELFE